MADQWELDTLTALNNIRATYGQEYLKWNIDLEKETRDYVFQMDAWELMQNENIPTESHLISHTCFGQHPIYPIPSYEVLIYSHKKIQYKIVGHIDGSNHYKRPIQPDYKIIPISPLTRIINNGFKNQYIADHIVSSCRCPHWTPPIRIAELLYSQQTPNHYLQSAIAIKNDDMFSYVALACK